MNSLYKSMYQNLLQDDDKIVPVLKMMCNFLPEQSKLTEDDIWNSLDNSLSYCDFNRLEEDVMIALEGMQ